METTAIQKSTRLYGLDVIRTISIIGMILTHTLESASEWFETAEFPIYSSKLSFLLASNNGWGQPVFMTCMGILIFSSRHRDAASHFKRGIQLFAGAYLLNIARTIFPTIFFLIPSQEWMDVVVGIFEGDILHLAGLCFLMIALFEKLKLKPYMVLITGFVFSIIGTLIIAFGNEYELVEGQYLGVILQSFMGLIFYVNDTFSSFSLLNHFIFFATGYFWGYLHTIVENKKKLNLVTLVSAFAAMVATLCIIGFCGLDNQFTSYPLYLEIGFETVLWYLYGIKFFDAILASSLVFVTIAIANMLTHNLTDEHVRSSGFWRVIGTASANLTPIYVIQWLIIGNLQYQIALAVSAESHSVLYTLLIGVAIIFISYFGGIWYKKLREQ